MKREPTRREQLRRAFHGPVLNDISEQVKVPHPDGKRYRYSPEAWKHYFAQMFAPMVETKLPDGTVEWRHSTEAIVEDDDYAAFLLKVQAHAATELGVTFTERKAPC